MAGLNRVFILGRLGKDPELRYLQDGNKSVCKFNVATSKVYVNKEHQKVETTEWHRITIWGKLGETVNKYLKKGDGALFIGELKTNSYDKDGQKHYATEVVVNEIHFLPSNPKRDVNSQQHSNEARPQSNGEAPPDFPGDPSFGGEQPDDDIPF